MSSGGSRVLIPADLLKTIQQIREMTGKQHSDEDILSVLKECMNDPYETAEKLLYLDTFHVVRSKRERKKEIIVQDTQGRGRDGRRNFASIYTGYYANNGRSAAFNRQSGANRVIGGPRNTFPAPNKAINDPTPRSIKSPNPRSPSNGVGNHKIQDGFISPVNNGVTKEQPLSKSTSSSGDVKLESTVPVTVSASDSVDGTSQISQQASTLTKQDKMLIATSNCSSQSDQVTRSEAAANKSKSPAVIKSDFGERPHVTFPVHLAKVVENGLTFGSFDSNIVKEAYSDNSTSGCGDSNVELSQGTAAYEASAREDISSVSQDKDHENSNSAPETEIALQSDQTVNPVVGAEGDKPSEVLPINQAANSDTPPPISYPDQSSIAAAQQAMHLFRQQYPPNFFPYGPYFPPFYMPQPYSNPFLNSIGHQQPSGDDAPTPPESTLPLSQISTVNSPTTIIASPYDSFNHIPTAATVDSTHKEEITENIYTNGALSAWMAAQSLANLQLSHMYNLALQGQTLPFPTAQPGFNGLYQQQTHPMTQTLPPIPGMAEPTGLPHTSNQQPQAALTNLGNN